MFGSPQHVLQYETAGSQHGASCFGPILFLSSIFYAFKLFFVLNIFLTLLLPQYKIDYFEKKKIPCVCWRIVALGLGSI